MFPPLTTSAVGPSGRRAPQRSAAVVAGILALAAFYSAPSNAPPDIFDDVGTEFFPESVIEHWHGDHATVRSLLDGSTQEIDASSIVTATTNVVFNDVELALAKTDTRFHVIGDAAAPRQAPYAFHDGRKIGLLL